MHLCERYCHEAWAKIDQFHLIPSSVLTSAVKITIFYFFSPIQAQIFLSIRFLRICSESICTICRLRCHSNHFITKVFFASALPFKHQQKEMCKNSIILRNFRETYLNSPCRNLWSRLYLLIFQIPSWNSTSHFSPYLGQLVRSNFRKSLIKLY